MRGAILALILLVFISTFPSPLRRRVEQGRKPSSVIARVSGPYLTKGVLPISFPIGKLSLKNQSFGSAILFPWNKAT